MMLFSPLTRPLSPLPDQFSTAPAIRSLLSYAEDFDDCAIDVEINDDAVLLTGVASSNVAVARAIDIVAGFTSRRVVCHILVASEAHL
jgi:hypothetical protein